MFRSGEFVAQYIDPAEGNELDDEQIQPNGVDLKTNDVLTLGNTSALSQDDKSLPTRTSLPLNSPYTSIESLQYTYDLTDAQATALKNTIQHKEEPLFENAFWLLEQGTYVAVYDEIIEIPDNHVGFVWPRSSIMRMGHMLNSAVWDGGYKGRGEGRLYVDNMFVLEKDARIGQIVFAKANTETQYEGQYQNERIDG